MKVLDLHILDITREDDGRGKIRAESGIVKHDVELVISGGMAELRMGLSTEEAHELAFDILRVLREQRKGIEP